MLPPFYFSAIVRRAGGKRQLWEDSTR